MVSQTPALIPVDQFYAGRLADFIDEWEKLTKNPFILSAIRGLRIELCEEINFEHFQRISPLAHSSEEVIREEIEKLLSMNAIAKVDPCPQQVLSPIFVRTNGDGTKRMILNLKSLNEFIPFVHFKMETLSSILPHVKKDSYFANFDLKSAYLSVKIHPEHRKLLRFQYGSQVYECNAMMFGLSPAPRIFTKIVKVILKCLRAKGICLFMYLDDGLIIACRGYDFTVRGKGMQVQYP